MAHVQEQLVKITRGYSHDFDSLHPAFFVLVKKSSCCLAYALTRLAPTVCY